MKLFADNECPLIAATALAHACGMVTNNAREFARVTGLRWEDWSG